jgi:hypothetical protein
MVLELRRVLDDLYRERQWVHIPLLIERVKSLKGSPTKSGLLRRLLTLCLNDIQLAWKRAWDPVALAEHNGVLEFAGTSEEFKELLTNSVAHGILWHRIHQQGLVSAPLSCCLILDDWARQARRTQFKPEDLTPLEILFGHGRTGGVRVELLTQSRESLPRYLVANCGIRVISAVSDFRDVFELGTDSGFTQEQLRWVSSGLKQDMRILHVSGEEPFVITVPLLRLEPVMTDAMCDDTLKVLASLPVELDEAFHRWEPFPVMDASNTAREDPNELRIPEDPVPAAGTDAGLPRSPRTHARRPVQGERPAGLRDQGGQADASAPHAPPLRRRSDRPDRQRHQGDLAEVRVLRAVLQNNGLGSSRLGRAVGIGAARAQAIKTRLLEQGLIREDRVQLGKRGSPTKCLRITDAGIASLRQLEGTGDAARE